VERMVWFGQLQFDRTGDKARRQGMTIELKLSERELAVARAVALAFVNFGDALTLVEVARIVAPDEERDGGLERALTVVWDQRLTQAIAEKEARMQAELNEWWEGQSDK
jgi:hypothetical protein